MLPELRIAWQPRDPGDPPRSDRLNHPPVVTNPADLVAAHQRWRNEVEQDDARIAVLHAQQPQWFPMFKTARHRVVPVMGGTSGTWDVLLTTLAIAAADAGFGTIRIVNLLQWRVFDSLQQRGRQAKRLGLRFDTVASTGSSIELFVHPSLDELASFVVDVLRVVSDPQGRRDSAREKADLVAIGQLLDAPVSLQKLTAAVDVALGQLAAQASPLLSKREERDLRDFHARVVAQRRGTADRLDGLHADLRELVRYQLSPQRRPLELGTRPLRIRAFDVDSGRGIHEFEMGRELLARAAARAFARPSSDPEALIVAGAEKLAPEVLDSLKGSAEQHDKQLVLLFSEITDLAERTLGSGGSGYAIFLRLPNASDAEVAARHVGKEYTFVVNGVTIAKGQTEEWSRNFGTSTSTTDTSGRHTGTNSGFGGGGFNFGRNFGNNVSKSFTTGENEGRTTGGSTSLMTTTATGRVHEHVIEPEEFQNLDDLAMLVVDGRRATLASCDYTLRNGAQTSAAPLVIP